MEAKRQCDSSLGKLMLKRLGPAIVFGKCGIFLRGIWKLNRMVLC